VAGQQRQVYGHVAELYEQVRPGYSNEMIDLVWTPAEHQLLPEDRREVALSAVASAIEAHGGTYEHPYVCRVLRSRAPVRRSRDSAKALTGQKHVSEEAHQTGQ